MVLPSLLCPPLSSFSPLLKTSPCLYFPLTTSLLPSPRSLLLLLLLATSLFLSGGRGEGKGYKGSLGSLCSHPPSVGHKAVRDDLPLHHLPNPSCLHPTFPFLSCPTCRPPGLVYLPYFIISLPCTLISSIFFYIFQVTIKTE